ncbi:hypothetical protein DSO57_1032452 [Entomophthora muscae]|uniref:Uncharacterized protein n=1 Tax=Entomophthora muscae TaxID=34485 RepID=A0ACC2RRG8_9FUNG|nr:hypothetical protein DSO57_1032452 [Entomophthora muscae]
MWMTASYLHAIDFDGKYTCFAVETSSLPMKIVSMEGKPSLDILRDTLNHKLLSPVLRISEPQYEEDDQDEEDTSKATPSSRFVRVFGAAMSPNGMQVAILFSQYINRLEYCITSTDFAYILFFDISGFSESITTTSPLDRRMQTLDIPPTVTMCSFMWDYLLAAAYCLPSTTPTPDLQLIIDTVLKYDMHAWEDAPGSPTTEAFAKLILFLYHSLKKSGMAQSPQFLLLRSRAASLTAYNMVCHLLRLQDCLVTFKPPSQIQSHPFITNSLGHIHTIATNIEKTLSPINPIDAWVLRRLETFKAHDLGAADETCPICSKLLSFGSFLRTTCQHGDDPLELPTTWERCQITFNPILSFYSLKCHICDTLVASPSPDQVETPASYFLQHYCTRYSPTLASSIISPFGLKCPHCAAQLK